MGHRPAHLTSSDVNGKTWCTLGDFANFPSSHSFSLANISSHSNWEPTPILWDAEKPWLPWSINEAPYQIQSEKWTQCSLPFVIAKLFLLLCSLLHKGWHRSCQSLIQVFGRLVCFNSFLFFKWPFKSAWTTGIRSLLKDKAGTVAMACFVGMDMCKAVKDANTHHNYGMGMSNAVKGANTHHDKGTKWESENVKSLNMYTESRPQVWII